MGNFIRDTFKKQMQILAERSIRENGEYLASITEQMIKLAIILEPEIQSELFPVVPLPLSERLTIADIIMPPSRQLDCRCDLKDNL